MGTALPRRVAQRFADHVKPTNPKHIATARVSLELVLRNLISDWGVKPRSKDWEAILKESAKAFDHPSH